MFTPAETAAAAIPQPVQVMALSRGITVNRELYPDVALTIPSGFKRDPQRFLTVSIDGAERVRKEFFPADCDRNDCADIELNFELALLQSGPVSLELLYNIGDVTSRNGSGLSAQSLGFRLAGNLSKTVGIAVGGESLVNLNPSSPCLDINQACGQLKGRTLFAVASAAFPLSSRPNPPVITVTAGAGNGYYGYNGSASDNQWGPIGSVSYAFNNRVSVGVEYSGYAISAGVSVRPLESFPLTASLFATDFLGNLPNNIEGSCGNQSCSLRVLGRVTYSF
ncbi:hypothetical protein KBY97_03515 [Synechococcus sp. ATX 2A4]|uniref:hypothetical protein n=1 Tax=Synechococcus sp. ATX 2A4 TaxID=2823727 RepID=UPI0020CC0EEA|nr:hypothetical protein [Synechococcus sp. ATX 2A4]MCP9884198.1 hypothetical protein [Synechococcus sp. ATX 2A4]